VLLRCPPALYRLLGGCAGIDQLITQGAPLPPYDAHAPLLSLPGLLGTAGVADIPAAVPYLAAEPALLEHWGRRLAELPGFTIGVAWQGNPKYRGDRQRSVPLEQFAALARLPGVSLVSLQKGAGAEQAGRLPGLHVFDGLDEAGAFVDTAALAARLDLVVSSDSAVAHVAAAVGARVWLLLPFAADWRWLLDREDCPWYPSMRLFRQQTPGDWGGVFARLASALQTLRGQALPPSLPVNLTPGELIDRITMLELTSEEITDPARSGRLGGSLRFCTPCAAPASRPRRTSTG
jgi:hypothetical protein